MSADAAMWDRYADSHRHGPEVYAAEPVQLARAQTIVRRCVGTVLDVGSSDGYVASLIRDAGHEVTVVDISEERIRRAREEYGLPYFYVGDAAGLAFFGDGTFDTVVLGEILEHLENPGPAIAEAHRVARQRVVVSVPLNGWADPTHQWRIRMDHLVDEAQKQYDATKGEQIVLTWERGACWPENYPRYDPTWRALFLTP